MIIDGGGSSWGEGGSEAKVQPLSRRAAAGEELAWAAKPSGLLTPLCLAEFWTLPGTSSPPMSSPFPGSYHFLSVASSFLSCSLNIGSPCTAFFYTPEILVPGTGPPDPSGSLISVVVPEQTVFRSRPRSRGGTSAWQLDKPQRTACLSASEQSHWMSTREMGRERPQLRGAQARRPVLG